MSKYLADLVPVSMPLGTAATMDEDGDQLEGITIPNQKHFASLLKYAILFLHLLYNLVEPLKCFNVFSSSCWVCDKLPVSH